MEELIPLLSKTFSLKRHNAKKKGTKKVITLLMKKNCSNVTFFSEMAESVQKLIFKIDANNISDWAMMQKIP